MKKILTTITVASLALVAFISCNKNEAPVFDDAKAFIAFSKTSTTISEDADTISIPVSLASVAGLEGSVTFKVVADTVTKVVGSDTIKLYPKDSVNYVILTEGGTLKFDKNNRTQNIVVAGVYCPDYTGDLSFRIILESKTQQLGYAKECTVVISDIDHPLTSILGAYTAETTSSAYQNPWTMTFYKDEKDDHMVWIDNIFANSGWSDATTRIYGNVKEEGGALTSIVIPLGQTVEYTYPYQGEKLPVYVLGCQIKEGNLYGIETGSVTATIGKDAAGKVTLDFGTETGFMLVIDGLGYASYAGQGITAVKN